MHAPTVKTALRILAVVTWSAAVASTGCGGDGGHSGIDARSEDPLAGGTLSLEGCGYEVTTRDGASAPRPAPAILGSDPQPRQIRLGVAGDPATSMVVLWRTADEGSDDPTLASQVEYGAGGSLERSANGLVHHYVSGFNGNGETVRVHEAHLCGLEPDTEYTFRVGGDDGAGNAAWSDTLRFRTAPRPGADAEVVLAIVGDSRDGYAVWEQMAGQIASHAPDLIVYSGDAVTLGPVQFEWESFFDGAGELLSAAPMISAHGNHEVNAVNFYSLFAMPGDEENYGLRYGPAALVVLNDTPVDEGAIDGASADVLEATLTDNADAAWTFVVHHKSMWSASNHGSNEFVRDAWGPIIDRHQVDMVFSGHDHNYERTKPMRGDQVAASPAEGTVYVVSGGAGAELYGNGSDYWTEISEETHSFVIVRLRAGMLEMSAYREDGTLLDEMTITK